MLTFISGPLHQQGLLDVCRVLGVQPRTVLFCPGRWGLFHLLVSGAPPYFVALPGAPGSSRRVPPSAVAAATSPRSPGVFYWRTVFRSQDLGQWCAPCCSCHGLRSWGRMKLDNVCDCLSICVSDLCVCDLCVSVICVCVCDLGVCVSVIWVCASVICVCV